MRHSLLRSFLGTVLALSGAPLCAQTTWFVDVNAPGPGTGSHGDPFPSIQAALINPALALGDDVSVAPGTYAEELAFTGNAVGIHIHSQEGPLVTTIAATSTSSTSITFEGWEWIEGFTLLGQGGDSRGTFTDHPKGGQMTNCIVRGYGLGCENLYDLALFSCTVAFNDVGIHHWGGEIGSAEALTFVHSSILWGNGTEATGQDVWGGSWIWNYSVQDDPSFWSPTNLRLRADSPAIDFGSPHYPLDPDGSRADSGALPFDGNYPVGTTYCLAEENSSGARGRIELSGTAAVSANDLGLHVQGLPPGVASLFFIGVEAVDLPLGNGRLCAGQHIGRLGLVFADGGGSASLAFDNTASIGGAPQVLAGQTRTFQNWFRDVPGGGAESNLTNAVAVPFTP